MESVFDLDLSIRAFNYLKRHSVISINQFIDHSIDPNVNKRLYEELFNEQERLKDGNEEQTADKETK